MRNKLPRVLAVVVATLVFTYSFAQKQITGTVTDEKQIPLAGATVSVKGTKVVTTSDASGKFTITTPANSRSLLVSFIGMQQQEIPIGERSIIAVTLTPSSSTMSDVVVIGYGTRRRAEVTSSISSISGKDIRDLPVAGVDQAIQGKIAGVSVTNNGGQPGGGVSVRVRGVTSINGNEPLYVIDGVPMANTDANSIAFNTLGGGGGQTANSALASINPNDIESIDVLKDASAQAIYGSQAANGVIIINTRRGRQGEGKMNYDVYVGRQVVSKKLDMMNLRDFARYQNDVAAATGITPTAEFANPDVLGEGTNWQDAIFQYGSIQNHQLSFSGGQNKTNYYFSANYFDQQGIIIGSKFRRYSMRFNLDQQVKTWLRAGVSANATKSNQKLTLADEQDGTITQALLQSPLIPIKNLDNSWGGPGTTVGNITYYQDNPVAKSELRDVLSDKSKLFGSLYADVNLGKYVTVRSEFAFDFNMSQNTAFQRAGLIGVNTPLQSHLLESRENGLFYVLRFYANYNQTFRQLHRVSATAGHEAQTSKWDYINAERYNLPTNDLVAIGVGEAANQQLGGGKGHTAMESYFARLGYTFGDRYSLNLSFRADASSLFGPNYKWGYFPAGSIGWTITNEKFAENWKFVNYAKLRFGIGAVGNQNPPSGSPRPPYTANVRFTTNGFGAGSFPRNIANPDLKWEAVITQNAGIDLSFLHKRVELSIDVYKKITEDMIMFTTAPRFIGVGPDWNDVLSPLANAGKMTNKGIDVSLTTFNITNKDLTWKTTVIFSHYKNRLDELTGEQTSIDGKVVYGTIALTHTVPGQPVGSFYGLVTDGLFRTEKDLAGSLPQFILPISSTQGTWLGDVRFVDINNDGKIDALDQTFIGSPHPKFTYGITNTVNFKGFDASIFLQGSYGGKIYNYLRRSLEGLENVFGNQLSTVNDRYTASNIEGALPRFTSNNKNNTAVSDRWVEDGSYMRIQNVSIGYNIPKNLLKKVYMTNARVYVSCQNLYTFTNYSGFDPEIGAYNKRIELMNVDNGHYPNPRSFTIGANIEF